MAENNNSIKIKDEELSALENDMLCSFKKSESSFDELKAARDIALVLLMLSTGLSAGKCAELNVESVDTESYSITVSLRGKETVISYYSSHVNSALLKYIGLRNKFALDNSLFINQNHKRSTAVLLKNVFDNSSELISKHITSNNTFLQTKDKSKQYFDELLNTLPPFCKTYFVGIAQRTTTLTQLNYARDLTLFFSFLKKETEEFAGVESSDFTVTMLNDVTAEMIENFLYYVTDYEFINSHGKSIDRFNSIQAKARKLSAISSLYRYFLKKKKIEKNPADFVEKPKKRDRAIIRLDPAEVAELLDAIESGEGQSDRQKKYNRSLVLRDVAIITLFLGTGIRISECTGVNIKDIDMAERAVLVTRKGQNQAVVYYGDEVEEALNNYMEVRCKQKAPPPDSDALFLSTQNKRISNRAVQKLVKKYAGIVTPLKHITPHKLRSTFGTNLYRETGDIYLVANALGHEDVNTTRKHYADGSEEMRIHATNNIRLRKEKSDK